MLMDEIEKKSRNDKKKIAIKNRRIKFNTKIKCWWIKLKKKSTWKRIKNKINNNQKNEDQNWYKYKLTWHI